MSATKSQKETTTVRCIDNSSGYISLLTEGRIYEAYGMEDDTTDLVRIEEGDHGRQVEAFRRRFVVVDEASLDPVIMENLGAQWKLGDTFTCKGDRTTYTIRNHEAKDPEKVTVTWDGDISVSYTIQEITSHVANGTFIITRIKDVIEPQPEPEYTIKVLCNNNMGYLDKLTVGKTYMAKTSTNRGEDDMYMIETNDRDDEPGYTIAFKHRFIEVKDEPKVGDVLTEEWLNSETPKDFHGYGFSPLKWETRTYRSFIDDRKISKIDMVDGRMAALISNTNNIWIDLESITTLPKPQPTRAIPNIAKEIPSEKMQGFLKELDVLIAKWK